MTESEELQYVRELLTETLLARKRAATLGIWGKIDDYFGLTGRYTGSIYQDGHGPPWGVTLGELKEYVGV